MKNYDPLPLGGAYFIPFNYNHVNFLEASIIDGCDHFSVASCLSATSGTNLHSSKYPYRHWRSPSSCAIIFLENCSLKYVTTPINVACLLHY